MIGAIETQSLPFSSSKGDCEGEGDRREDKLTIIDICIGAVEGLPISIRAIFEFELNVIQNSLLNCPFHQLNQEN